MTESIGYIQELDLIAALIAGVVFGYMAFFKITVSSKRKIMEYADLTKEKEKIVHRRIGLIAVISEIALVCAYLLLVRSYFILGLCLGIVFFLVVTFFTPASSLKSCN